MTKLDGSHNKANYQNYYITELSKKSAKYENETIYPYHAKTSTYQQDPVELDEQPYWLIYIYIY